MYIFKDSQPRGRIVTVELTLSGNNVTQEAWEGEDHGEIALQPVLYRSVCCKSMGALCMYSKLYVWETLCMYSKVLILSSHTNLHLYS